MIPADNQNLWVTLPIAGQVASFAVTTSAMVIDLASIGGPSPGNPENAKVNAQDPAVQGVLNAYITIYADGADVGIIASDTFAKVSGGNAPSLAAAGTVNSGTGVYAPSTGECYRLVNGQSHDARPTAATRYLGIVGAAAGSVRISLSSPV